MNMNELTLLIQGWGIEKGITGAKGKATVGTQAQKMIEEAVETLTAAIIFEHRDEHNWTAAKDELKDGIGDTFVTLVLLAERASLTIEECVQAAYDVISKRKGQMIDGTFVKEKEGA